MINLRGPSESSPKSRAVMWPVVFGIRIRRITGPSVLGLAVVSVLLFCAQAIGAVRSVPLEYGTIQAALTASVDGDEIVIFPGTYVGEGNRDLDFDGKAVTVRSVDPSDPTIVASTVIDCRGDENDAGRAFSFLSGEGNDSRLIGLTIANGFAPVTRIGAWSRRTGGAILCVGSSPRIDRCVFLGNRADYGGAVACWESSRPVVVDSVFDGNVGTLDGAAIFVRDSSPDISNGVFHGNLGTVISSGGTGAMSVTGCVIRENVGSAIRCAQANATISRCVVARNDVVGGASNGMIVTSGSDVVIDNCLVAGNGAVGVVSMGGRPVVDHCTIVGNDLPAVPEGPRWIDAPDQSRDLPGTVRAFWRDRLWAFQSRRLRYFDGTTFQPGGLTLSENAPRRTYFTDVGVFVFSYRDGVGYLERSVDGMEDFQIALSGIASENSLPRSLVWCGVTDAHPDGVMFYFEYAYTPRVYTSTDGGASFFELFGCADGAIRHFHGVIFAPSVGVNGGRLYVFTGDQNHESSVLICDDVDDLIANPESWQARWGLDVADEHRIELGYTINDDLDATGTPTSQTFRIVDLLVAGDGYGYWTVDSAMRDGQPVYRVNHATKVVERVGMENAIGAGWLWLETESHVKLFLTEVGLRGQVPKPGHDEFVHLYGLSDDGTDFRELRRWARSDAAAPVGPVIPQYFFEGLDYLWFSLTSGSVEHGTRNVVGHVEPASAALSVGLQSHDADVSIENSVVWGNRIAGGWSEQLRSDLGEIRYNCIEGWSANPDGSGNVSFDPRFRSPDGADGAPGTEDDDFRLRSDSPCINSGDPLFDASPLVIDISSSLRTRCIRTDMGAYEFGFGDFDCDRVLSLQDLSAWDACMLGPRTASHGDGCQAFDNNGDTRVDLADFAAFQTAFEG